MTEKPIIRVLMTGAGAPGGPGIILALQQNPEIQLLAADANPEASGRFICPQFAQIPSAADPTFVARLLELCKTHAIDVVLPLVTRELFVLAAHKDEFEKQGIRIVVSDPEHLPAVNNKGMLYNAMSAHGIPVPRYYIVNTIDEFKQAANALGDLFCFKPTVSNGSRGFRVVTGGDDEASRLFTEKPDNTRITLPQALALLEKQAFPQLLVSEYLPGEEYTIDTLFKHGKLSLILPRRRIAMREGISIRGEFVNNNEIINYIKEIAGIFPLHGPIGFQVKQDAGGAFRILEINPRLQGTSVAAMGLGINLPYLAVMQEFNREKEIMPVEIAWGLKFVRYYREVFYR